MLFLLQAQTMLLSSLAKTQDVCAFRLIADSVTERTMSFCPLTEDKMKVITQNKRNFKTPKFPVQTYT
jgi:hypothetical protein